MWYAHCCIWLYLAVCVCILALRGCMLCTWACMSWTYMHICLIIHTHMHCSLAMHMCMYVNVFLSWIHTHVHSWKQCISVCIWLYLAFTYMHKCVSARLQRGCMAVAWPSHRRHCRSASLRGRSRSASDVLTSLEWVPLNFHTFASGAADPSLSEEVQPQQRILGGATMRTLIKSMVLRLWLDHDSTKLNSSVPSDEDCRIEALPSTIHTKGSNNHNMICTIVKQYTWIEDSMKSLS